MLSLKSPLSFPKIVRLGRADDLYPVEGKGSSAVLYKLDWSHHDKAMREGHEKWLKATTPSPHRNEEFVETFDKEWDSFVTDKIFQLNQWYLEEIRRNAAEAVKEWNIDRSFDTNVREFCLGPAIKHVEIAFYLLGDCIFDNETRYFSRDERSSTWRFAAGCKFWHHQTGVGCVMRNSGLSQKIEFLERIKHHYSMPNHEYLDLLKELKEATKGVLSELKGIPETEPVTESVTHSPGVYAKEE